MARTFSLYCRARKCWKDDWSQTCFLLLFAYFVFIYLEKSEDSLLKPHWVACDATEKPELRLAWSRPGYSIECFSYPLLWNLPFCFLPSSLVQWLSFSPKLFNHSDGCHGQWIWPSLVMWSVVFCLCVTFVVDRIFLTSPNPTGSAGLLILNDSLRVWYLYACRG